MSERQDPTADEVEGMKWWDDLPPALRGEYTRRAGSSLPRDAWDYYKSLWGRMPKAPNVA
jgi:hypothetical protein